ncbi:hypothetical protein K456DRAFT_202629 [Colletotrichum gloeosporioides 23]|nr:hypothetical protein K456DRAFT_202629 [Colletotrichum gloeosporioides 23]
MVSWVRAREIWVIRTLLTHPKGCLKARWLVQDDGLLTGFCVVPLALTNVFCAVDILLVVLFCCCWFFFPLRLHFRTFARILLDLFGFAQIPCATYRLQYLLPLEFHRFDFDFNCLCSGMHHRHEWMEREGITANMGPEAGATMLSCTVDRSN